MHELKDRCQYDVISLCQVYTETRLPRELRDADIREYFYKRPVPSLRRSFMLDSCVVWKLRLELRREISDISIDNEIRRKLLIDDRWENLREFMFIKAERTTPLIYFPQILESHLSNSYNFSFYIFLIKYCL